MKKQKEINASLTIRQLFDFSDTGGKKSFQSQVGVVHV